VLALADDGPDPYFPDPCPSDVWFPVCACAVFEDARPQGYFSDPLTLYVQMDGVRIKPVTGSCEPERVFQQVGDVCVLLSLHRAS
jgi:hypothetical protein